MTGIPHTTPAPRLVVLGLAALHLHGTADLAADGLHLAGPHGAAVTPSDVVVGDRWLVNPPKLYTYNHQRSLNKKQT